MIYVTGDTHSDYTRFSTENFPEQRGMTKEDFVIVCGDFGYWRDDREQAYWMDWLESKPFTTLFVDGNHENFDLLYRLPRETRYGGEVHVVRPSVLHLMRGQVFTFGGLTWFTMGGASSHDIRDGILDPKEPDFEQRYWLLRRMRAMFRVKGVSWWAEEMPNSQEYADALSSLDRMNWKVDCILTHCGPSSIVRKIDPSYGSDQLTNFLDMVNQRCQFIYWFFGHYHDNRIIDDRYILQWEQISGLEL